MKQETIKRPQRNVLAMSNEERRRDNIRTERIKKAAATFEKEGYTTEDIVRIFYDVLDEFQQETYQKVETAARNMELERALQRQMKARKAAESRYNQPGGFAERKEKVRALLATGKYRTKSDCAVEAAKKFKIKYDTALKWLNGEKNPFKK